jgi:hypothetical protein
VSSSQWPPQGSGSGSGVSSLNSLTGSITLTEGSGITITPSGSDIEISSSGGGANTALSNLASTNINVDLLTTNAVNIGSDANPFGQIHGTQFRGEFPAIVSTSNGNVGMYYGVEIYNTSNVGAGTITGTSTDLDIAAIIAAGNLNLTTANSSSGDSGNIIATPGTSTSGTNGSIMIQDSAGNNAILINSNTSPTPSNRALVWNDGSTVVMDWSGLNADPQGLANFGIWIATPAGESAPIAIETGAGTEDSSGTIAIATGPVSGSAFTASGSIFISTGNSSVDGVPTGSVTIQGGTATTGNAGAINIFGGQSSILANSGGVALADGNGNSALRVYVTGVYIQDDTGAAAALFSNASRILYASDGTTKSVDFTAPARVSVGTITNLFNATSDPGSAIAGDCYFNTTSHVIRIYNGTTWQSVTAV